MPAATPAAAPRPSSGRPRRSRARVLGEPTVALVLGAAALALSLRWVSSLGFFELGGDIEIIKTISIRTECPGHYTAAITADVTMELHQIWERAKPDSPGSLSVVIRRDPASGDPPVLSCTKFWVETSSAEVAERALVNATFIRGGKEVLGEEKKSEREYVAPVNRRKFSLDVIEPSKELTALAIDIKFDRMAIGVGYAKKVVEFSYEHGSDNITPTFELRLPFSFEANSPFPSTEQLSVRRSGVALSSPAAVAQPFGAFVTDNEMMQDKEIILFFSAALLGTGVALIAEFFRALVRTLVSSHEAD